MLAERQRQPPPPTTLFLIQFEHTADSRLPAFFFKKKKTSRIRQNSIDAETLPKTPRRILHRSRNERHLHPRRRRIPDSQRCAPRSTNPGHRNGRLPSCRCARRHFCKSPRFAGPSSGIHHGRAADRIWWG